MDEGLKSLIKNAKVMTLSTTGDGPWSSPVYYVYYENAFWYFSSKNSRHSPTKGKFLQAGASIYIPSDEWQNICGLQMSGYIEEAEPGILAAKVFAVYLKKFPLVKDFFKEKRSFDLKDLMNLFRVVLYRFVPDRGVYVDNSKGFGYKEEVEFK